jgi:hypothetical protein
LSNGEGCERIWSLIRHVIAQLRVAAPARRIQTLGVLLLFVGDEKQFSLAVSFNALFKLAFCKIKECNRELDEFFARTDISMEELLHEGDLMLKYFRNPTAQASSDSVDDICELIMALMEMDVFDHRHHGLPPSSIKTINYMEMKRRISRRTAGRIAEGIDVTKEVIKARLETLLTARNESMEEWVKDGKPTSKFEEVFREIHLTHIRRMRNNIFTEVAQRRLEYSGLHSSFHGIFPPLSDFRLTFPRYQNFWPTSSHRPGTKFQDPEIGQGIQCRGV